MMIRGLSASVLIALLATGGLAALAQSPESADIGAGLLDTPGASAQQQPEAGLQSGEGASRNPLPNPIEDARDRIYYPGDTERFKPLLTKLGGNILLDQKEIWTSPFHMHAKDSKWWILFGAATVALIATDHKTSTLLENSRGQISWGNNISKIGTSYTLIPLVAGFYGFGVWRNDPKAREVGVLGAEALLDSLIVVEVLKPIAGRNRPNSTNEGGHFFEGGGSFPSGHAIQAWTIASLLTHEYGHTKIVPIVAIGLASIVSVARIAAQQHYASDVVVGGAMGWFIGSYVYNTHMDHAIHSHGVSARIFPQFEPRSRTYALSLAVQTTPEY
jgi:membrane-associated phospholipid phosphatase